MGVFDSVFATVAGPGPNPSFLQTDYLLRGVVAVLAERAVFLSICANFYIVRSLVKKSFFVFEFGLKGGDLGVLRFNGETNICEADFGFSQLFNKVSEFQFEFCLLE